MTDKEHAPHTSQALNRKHLGSNEKLIKYSTQISGIERCRMLASGKVNQRMTDPVIARLLEENNMLLCSIDEKLRKIIFNTNGK